VTTQLNNKISQSPTIVKVGLYLRVSSQEQAKHGISLADQQQRLESWAHMEGWEIAGIYSDEGYSGGTDNRPELQRLLQDAKSGAFNLVAVTKLDRFFRNIRLTLNYIHELETSAVSFVAHDDNIDTRQPGMAKILLNMLASMAEFERERIGERISDFRTHLAAKGQWSSGRTPFGYRFNKTTKELIIDPLEAEAVRTIFSTYTQNEIGLVRTAEVCNSKGLITPRMGRRQHTTWTQSAVRHVLTHPAYKGGPNEDWPFNTPVIVKPEIWDAAQRQLTSNRHFRATDSHSPFQGLLRCGLCDHTLRIGYNHSTKRVWECPGRLKRLHLDGSPRCTLPRFDSETFEKRLTTMLKTILNDPALLDKYIEDTIKELEKEKGKLERKLKPVQGNIDRQKDAMTRADTMFELGRLSKEEYRTRIAGIRKRIAELEKQADAADPMLLRQLTDTEKQLKYWTGYSHLKGFMAKRGKELRTGPALDIFTTLQGLAPVPSYDFIDKPLESVSQQLRKMGLYVYVYLSKLEIKGNIRQSNIYPVYR
jgi:site-specific DNA recombinase